MSIMPNSDHNNSRINDNADFRDGYAEGFLDAIAEKPKVRSEAMAAVTRLSVARRDLTAEQRSEILAAIDAAATVTSATVEQSPAERLLDETAQRWQREHRELLARIERADCPDWCTIDHAEDDARDDLVLHQGSDHTDGTVRKLLNPDTLDIKVSRTDCTSEGRVGTPALTVYADMELKTWHQAAELARTILDAFGYLEGAES